MGTTISAADDINEGIVRQRIFELRRKVSKDKRPFYILIDGLENIQADFERARYAILDLLPFGTPGFRFVFSGTPEQALGARKGKLRAKSLPLNAFSPHETKEFLCDLALNDDDIRDVHSTFKGIPGRLATVRRLLESGIALSALLEDPEIKELIALEWNTALANFSIPQDVIALVAFARSEISCKQLSEISDLPEQRVREALTKLSFIAIDSKNTVTFVSQQMQRYVQAQLKHLEDKSIDAFATYLLRDPYRKTAVSLVPGYLQILNRPTH